MSSKSIAFDKVSIGLSLLCSVQCLALPLLALLLPTASFLSFEGEGLHNVLLLLVLPISCSALLMGYKQHKSLKVLLMGVTGLIILCGAFFLGHVMEKTLTVFASILVAYSHYLNFKHCSLDVGCSCHPESSK